MEQLEFQVMQNYQGTTVFDALVASIKALGLDRPIDVDESGAILDGHHRAAALKTLGKDWREFTRLCANARELDQPGKRTLARRLNLAGRHLSSESLRAVIADQIRETPGLTARSYAVALGVSHSTVGDVLRGIEAEAAPASSGHGGQRQRKAKDGRMVPAIRPKTKRGKLLEGAERAANAAPLPPDGGDDAPVDPANGTSSGATPSDSPVHGGDQDTTLSGGGGAGAATPRTAAARPSRGPAPTLVKVLRGKMLYLTVPVPKPLSKRADRLVELAGRHHNDVYAAIFERGVNEIEAELREQGQLGPEEPEVADGAVPPVAEQEAGEG